MTDLHCHILPNIDDGAKDVSISLRLLEKEYADGVRNIAFTSHFNSEWTTPDAFLQKRAAAYETLTAALPTGPEAMQFRFKLGCEVYFSPKLCELDAKALCIGDTSYMLVEFPTTHKPHFIRLSPVVRYLVCFVYAIAAWKTMGFAAMPRSSTFLPQQNRFANPVGNQLPITGGVVFQQRLHHLRKLFPGKRGDFQLFSIVLLS